MLCGKKKFQQNHNKQIITKKNHLNQTSTKNPLATPAKSQQKIYTKSPKSNKQITTNLKPKPKPKLHTTTIKTTTINESLCKDSLPTLLPHHHHLHSKPTTKQTQ